MQESLSKYLGVDIDIMKEKQNINQNLRKMPAQNFGDVCIKVFIQSLNDHAIAIFSLLRKLFHQAQKIDYYVDLSIIRKNVCNQAIKTLLDQGLTNQIKLLQLSTSCSVFFSADALKRIKVLNIYCKPDEAFNLAFENLNISYPNTQFSIYFYSIQQNYVESIYSQIPNYFDTQRCKISGTSINMDKEEYSDISYIQKRFPNNEIRWIARFSNLLGKEDLKESCIFLNGHQEQILVEEYIVQLDYLSKIAFKCYNLKCLAKFKIKSVFMFIAQQCFEIPQITERCECTPWIKITIDEAQENWAAKTLKILKGFCKYENAKNVIIENQMQCQNNSNDYKELLLLLGEFSNIKTLTLPLECYNGVANDVIGMLKKLKNLKNLKFGCQDQSDFHIIAEATQNISKYGNEIMKELRTINFSFQSIIQMKWDIMFTQRAVPLTISITIKDRTYFIYDPRFGMRNILQDKIQT